MEVSYHPVVRSDIGMDLAEGEVKESVLRAFEKRSRQLGTDAWKEGWHRFCEENREMYTAPLYRFQRDLSEREKLISVF